MYNNMPYFSPRKMNLLNKKAFSWDGFLNNAQRTLNVINQAMPIYKEVKPMFRNVGTVMKIISSLNTPATTTATSAISAAANTPTFFA